MRGEIHGTSLLQQQQHNIHPVKVVPRDDKLNISSHTGEEFSEEFLRERLTPRRTPARNDTLQPDTPVKGANVSHNQDFNSHLGTKGRGSDCVAEIYDFSVGKGYGSEVENHEMHDGSSRYRLERAPSGLQQSKFSDGSLSRSGFSGHGSGSPNSYQPYNSGWGFTNSSSSGKMKFLCSFGGRILPRPNDGNLRYVGGETRIMSIRKNLTYIELVRKTNSIFSQPHAIKYQLPGEDLDALISVSCDEDLHHMIEEYQDLERCSQRLRIFLVPLNDPESPCSLDVRTTLSQVDSEYQYVVAVNGMLDPSPRWSSSRESLGSQIGSGLDHCSPTAHQMEFRDGTTHKMNHPSTSTQAFNNASPQYHSKSYFSPSMFPSPAKLRESRNSRIKLYEDIPHAESHEFRTPNAMDHPAYHNSYNMDTTNYYYNQQKYLPQFHTPAKDFVAFPSFSNVEVDTKRHRVNELTMQSENLVNSSSRMVHGVSQPQMLSDEGTSATLEERNSFSPNFAVEKSPSFSGSPKQWTIQQQENTEKYPGERNENMLKHNKFSDRNACNASSMDERSNLPEIVHRVGEIVIHRSLPVEAEGLKIRESAPPPSNSLEKTGAQQRDHQSRAGESEFPIKSQKETEDPEHPVNISFSSNAMDESVEASCSPFSLNHPPSTDFIFPNPVDRTKSAMVKVPSNSLKKEEPLRKTSFQDQMLGYHHSTKQFSSKKAEATFIIEDVTDGIPSNIPSSPTVIPLVQDEPNDGVSPREETESESFADHEEGKSDDDRKKDSIEDPVTIEMEAGIYGLQIIKYGDLEELQELGSGTYGTVYHGKWRGTDVAIKRIKKSCFAGRHSEQDRLTTDFWREAKILSKLHHPNIVAFYGVVPDGPGATLATVTEFMIDGSLRHVLLRKGALDRRKKLMIAMDAAFGMEYLHMKNVVHFDLKCDNLLVNLGDPQRPVCKVGDFGLSRIKHNTLVSGGVRGTLPWMAPELLHGSSNRVSEKVDVFSFGITMWEMLTGEEPYANLHCGAIIGGIVNNTLRPRIPERCDPEWRKLMEECWSPDPFARPSFTEITKRLRVMSMALQAKRTNRVRR